MGVENDLVKGLRMHCDSKHGKDYFSDMYLRDYSGCVHHNYEGEDVMTAIIEKFDAYFITIAKRLDKEFNSDVRVVIQPSYESDTDIVMYDNVSKTVLYTNRVRAWHLKDMGVGEIADDLLSIYQSAVTVLSLRVKKMGA